MLLLQGIGVGWVNDLQQYFADQRMQQRISTGNYNPDQLIELSVELSLPYTTNWGEWEQVEGEVMVNGIAYRYVERKLENGTMHVRCIPNLERQRLAMESFAGQRNKFRVPNEKSNDHLANQHVAPALDYDDCLGAYGGMLKQSAIAVSHHYGAFLNSLYLGVLSPPPDLFV